MANDDTDIWDHLIERYPDTVQQQSGKLVEVAKDEPHLAEEIAELIANQIPPLAMEDSPPEGAMWMLENLTNLAATYPELSTYPLESLIEATRNGDRGTRDKGYQNLGKLAGNRPVDHTLLADTLTDGLSESYNNLNMTAAWSLTRVGLGEPGAVVQYWSQLATRLASTTYDTERELNSLDRVVDRDLLLAFMIPNAAIARRYVAEALAVSATAKTHSLRPGDPLAEGNRGEAAAWAIHQVVNDYDLPAPRSSLLAATTTVLKGHALAPWLLDQLIKRVQTDPEAGVHSLLAIGYIAPGTEYYYLPFDTDDPLFTDSAIDRSQIKQALELIQEDNSEPDLAHTPWNDTEMTGPKIEVADPDGKHIEGNQVGLPKTIQKQILAGRDNIGSESRPVAEGDGVLLTGNDSQKFVSLSQLHDHETIWMDKTLRRKLNVKVGEQIEILSGQPLGSDEDDEVELTLPTDFERSASDFSCESVCRALEGQGLYLHHSDKDKSTDLGNVLPAPVAVDSQIVTDLAKSLDTTALLRVVPYVEKLLNREIVDSLPFVLTNAHPQFYRKVKAHTEISLQDEPFAYVGDWWEGLSPGEATEAPLVHDLMAETSESDEESAILRQIATEAGLRWPSESGDVPVSDICTWLADPVNRVSTYKTLEI